LRDQLVRTHTSIRRKTSRHSSMLPSFWAYAARFDHTRMPRSLVCS